MKTEPNSKLTDVTVGSLTSLIRSIMHSKNSKLLQTPLKFMHVRKKIHWQNELLKRYWNSKDSQVFDI